MEFACHLLGLENEAQLRRSPFWGPVFEGHVVSEIMKQQQGASRRREVYFFRDQRGLEVDFLVPHGRESTGDDRGEGQCLPAARGREGVAALMAATRAHEAHGFVVHLPRASGPPLRALRPGVHALPLDELLAALGGR